VIRGDGRRKGGFRVLFWSAALFRRFLFYDEPRCPCGAKKQKQSGGKAPHSKCGAGAKGDNGERLVLFSLRADGLRGRGLREMCRRFRRGLRRWRRSRAHGQGRKGPPCSRSAAGSRELYDPAAAWCRPGACPSATDRGSAV